MAQCFLMTQQYAKVIEKATLALGIKRQAKVLYRRSLAFSARKDYEAAIKDLTEALTLESDEGMKATISKELEAAR